MSILWLTTKVIYCFTYLFLCVMSVKCTSLRWSCECAFSVLFLPGEFVQNKRDLIHNTAEFDVPFLGQLLD